MSSMKHLERHQRDPHTYRDNVRASADNRFGPAWWGVWDQHIVLPREGTVVDLGTGPGTLLALLRNRHPSARLIGVELHPLLLELALPAGERCGAEIVAADLGHDLPLPDDVADVVCSSLVFHELPYPPVLLDHAARLVRPGGQLVLFDIVKWPLQAYLADAALSPDKLDHYREHCLFTPDDLAFLVTQAGFEVDEVVLRSGGRFAMIVATRV